MLCIGQHICLGRFVCSLPADTMLLLLHPNVHSWRDAHVLALLQAQASLVHLLDSPARLPPHEQPVPCGDSFSIANTLLAVAAHNEHLFLARPGFVNALIEAAEDALLQVRERLA